ncbi:MAG: universal stress protein [Bacteroidia bacterium]|jgi:nucleotide-binding universal stress UspA family protein
MKSLQIKKILVPLDFSKTGLLALEHAVFMARLHKADLYLLHTIEISETMYSIYNPAVIVRDMKEVEKIVLKELGELAAKIKKEHSLTVKAFCSRGQVAVEIITAVKENDIDLVIMGTHGAKGFSELFIGSNAHKTVTMCPCPVITVQTHAKKIGFTSIVLPIDDSFPSRQKVYPAINLAKKYGATIHIIGLLDKSRDTNLNKFQFKLDSVEKAVKKSGLAYDCKIVKGDSLAVAALKYSKKVKADLIVILTDHESNLTGMFLGAFAKQIVNHSRIPVMSIRPDEGIYESVSLAGANPF